MAAFWAFFTFYVMALGYVILTYDLKIDLKFSYTGELVSVYYYCLCTALTTHELKNIF